MPKENDSEAKYGKIDFKSLFIMPEKIKDSYMCQTIQKNHYTISIIVMFIFVVELFNIIRVLFFTNSKLETLNNRIYFGMYCALIAGCLIFLILERVIKANLVHLSRLYAASVFYMTIWHVLLNCYELSKDSQSGTIVLMTAFFSVSVLIQMRPVSALMLYLLSYLVFLSLSASVLDTGTIINISIAVVVSIFISITSYTSCIKALTQEVEIKRINEQLKKEQDELRISLEKHEIIMEQSNEVIFEWDILANSLMFSHIGEVEFQCPPVIDEIDHWIRDESGIYEEDKQAFIDMMKECLGERANCEAELRIKNKTGKYVWYRARIFLQYDIFNIPIHGIGVFSNIDIQKNHLEELTTQLQNDPLTEILNKIAFQDGVQEYISRISNDRTVAMLMLDLDNFKSINDRYGHPYGDYVLKKTAEVMREVFRKDDFLGRLGGDEFAVVISDVKNGDILTAKAQKLLDEIGKIKFKDCNDSASCSIGISTAQSGAISYDEFYKKTDSALYEAKRMGKGCYYISNSAAS